MGPDKVTHRDGKHDADYDIDLMKIVPQVVPPFTHLHTDVGQEVAPGQGSDKCEQHEPRKIHPRNSRRQ
jgi:hypothetical protein